MTYSLPCWNTDDWYIAWNILAPPTLSISLTRLILPRIVFVAVAISNVSPINLIYILPLVLKVWTDMLSAINLLNALLGTRLVAILSDSLTNLTISLALNLKV